MTREFIHPYKGFGRVPSTCLVKMIDDDGETFICFIDIGDGTSVTNASEQLASEIVNEYKLDSEACQFFETYQQYDYENFDEIRYDWKTDTFSGKWIASKPRWKPGLEELKQIFTEE